MDYSKLIRDDSIAPLCLSEQDTGELVAIKPIRIVFPSTYLDGKLGFMEEDIKVIGFFALILGDRYKTFKTMALIPLTPDTTTERMVDGVKYTELGFEVGSVVCPNINVLQDQDLAFQAYDEIVAKGKNPWYFNYVDNSQLFRNAKTDAGANLNASPAILSIFAASRARVKGDRVRYYRETLEKQSDLETTEPDMIPARSVAFGATNTTARLAGSYFSTEGIVSSLVNQSKESESFEELLRM